MIIWWLSTQFICFMTSGHVVWLPWQHSVLKKEFFKWQLRNPWISMTLIWYKCCLDKGNPKQLKLWWSASWLVAMATENSHSLIMGTWLNCIFTITIEVMWTIFGSYDHLMIVYPVFVFDYQQPFCLVAMATFSFEKGFFQMTTSTPLKQYDSNLVQKLLG